MPHPRSYAVTVLGSRYSIKSDADEAYVQALAARVDDKMRQLARAAKTAPPAAIAVLAALQLADELERERERRRSLRRRVRDTVRDLREALARAEAP